MKNLKYLEYFEKATKDLKNRSDVKSEIFKLKWGMIWEKHEVTFEHANEVSELSIHIKYDENGGYEEVWYSGYEKQFREASNVNDAVENAKYLIDYWKALKDKGVVPEVYKEYDKNTWVYVKKYPEKGELMIVADVRYTVMVSRKDGTFETCTVTVRGKDDLSEGLTDEFFSLIEKLLD